MSEENKKDTIDTEALENETKENDTKESETKENETKDLEVKNTNKPVKNNRKNIIMISVIVALVAIIAVLLVVILKKDKKDNNESDDNTVATSIDAEKTEDSSDEEKNTQDKTETDITTEEATKEDAKVTVELVSQWEGNGKFCGQINFTIFNQSSNELKGWSVEIEVPSGFNVDSSWNCEQEVKDNHLIVKGDTNFANVPANSQLKDIGMIVSVDSQSELTALTKNPVLYVGGKKYTSENVADNKTEESDTTENSVSTENSNSANNSNSSGNSNSANNTNSSSVTSEKGSPYANHGKLKVSGVDIVDASGNKYQLKGVSTHGIAWFPDYVNEDAFRTLRDEWGANLIRIAMYSAENNGYCTGGNKEQLKGLVDKGVQAATNLGMYVIIDWHVLGDKNPLVNKEEAKAFFDEMSKKYKDYGNVIYEICNEPNGGTGWPDVKSYAEEVIPVIRANAPDAIIIVGTPNWSQDVDIAAGNPITGYSNIMYALHFYAATHKEELRNKASKALDAGLPIFVSEFSICDASGNGGIDYGQAEAWLNYINQNNMSYASWSLCNKNETSALISSSCSKTSGWTDSDLSEAGKWIKKMILGQ